MKIIYALMAGFLLIMTSAWAAEEVDTAATPSSAPSTVSDTNTSTASTTAPKETNANLCRPSANDPNKLDCNCPSGNITVLPQSTTSVTLSCGASIMASPPETAVSPSEDKSTSSTPSS